METRILQFGEGNFLRCFIDWMVQRMNDRVGFAGGVQIIQPIGEELSVPSRILNERGGRYHTCLRGVIGGKTVEEIGEVSCVAGVDLSANVEKYATIPSLRFVVSNTTEAGIQYVKGADTFPAKVLRLLRARFAAGLPGLVFIPCELIEHNGDNLKACVLKHLSDEPDAALGEWIAKECVFCSTLVDRIVAGRPDEESAARYEAQLGERDETLVCGEPFHFFVVETPDGFDLERELPSLRSRSASRTRSSAHSSARSCSTRYSRRSPFPTARRRSTRIPSWSASRIRSRTTSSGRSRSTRSRSGRPGASRSCATTTGSSAGSRLR